MTINMYDLDDVKNILEVVDPSIFKFLEVPCSKENCLYNYSVVYPFNAQMGIFPHNILMRDLFYAAKKYKEQSEEEDVQPETCINRARRGRPKKS